MAGRSEHATRHALNAQAAERRGAREPNPDDAWAAYNVLARAGSAVWPPQEHRQNRAHAWGMKTD